MAKRKRLSPEPMTGGAGGAEAAPETKSAFPMGVAVHRPRPPIAGVAGDSASAAAAEELAETLRRAREEGRMVIELPLEAVQADYLVRDRIAVDPDEMAALAESLRLRGQQTPVEVADLGSGRYGLISGWRRLNALKGLAAETGEARFGTVLALVRRPGEAAEAYLAMVEENEIRVGLSYYERARIAGRTVAQGVYPDAGHALRELFRAASRAKRSKIRSFLVVVEALDGALHFPEAIGERLGLTLAKALEADPKLAGRIRAALAADPPADPEAEQAVLSAAMRGPARGRAQAPRPERIAEGVEMLTRPDGTLTLRGARVDAALRAALVEWLARRG